MPFDPIIAAIRFGTGLSPHIAPPRSIDAMLARLRGPDAAAVAIALPDSAHARPSLIELRTLTRARNDARGTAGEAAATEAFNAARVAVRTAAFEGFKGTLARGMMTDDGLRERLVRFWADHFTVVGKNANNKHLVGAYVEEAIRPHVAGRFGAMLGAVVTHPMMLDYLDQWRSVGPESPYGLRSGRGLNENLARELLELHTLGVGGPYGQDDVRQLAELLTGLTWHPDRTVEYRPILAEPGAETVLGQTFSADASMDTIRAALDMLALHPATAAHLARKIAVHFVADSPDPGLVAALTDAYAATGGDLMAVTAALLGHPAAWAPERAKIKQPFGFLQSALRALAVPVAAVQALEYPAGRTLFLAPLVEMGQSWETPRGPDGWPESADAWITPQAMAARISWSFGVPERLLPDLPDPRAFVIAALGPAPDEAVAFAARAAESRPEGIGLVLSSPAFQRR